MAQLAKLASEQQATMPHEILRRIEDVHHTHPSSDIACALTENIGAVQERVQRQREEVFRLKHQREVGEEEEAQLKARPIAACATCRMQHTHDMCTTGYIL